MKSSITSILLIILSLGLFFGFVDPMWRDAKAANEKLTLEKNDLKNIKIFQEKRDSLLAEERSVSQLDRERLAKLVPDSIDSVKLILEIYRIGQESGVNVRSVDVTEPSRDGTLSTVKYGTLPMRLVMSGSYENFKVFLRNIEKSLTLLDVTGITLRPQKTSSYEYTVSAKTYWLK